MKAASSWSYSPYTQYIKDGYGIYISRVAPFTDGVTFDYFLLDNADGNATDGVNAFEVHTRERGTEEWTTVKVSGFSATVKGLKTDTDYEFYVSTGEIKSRVRLVRPYTTPGPVINYLHPQDEAYGFSGHYLSSPSIIKTKKGTLVASMDVFGDKMPQNLTLIYRSEDNGDTWHYSCELMPCFWGELFEHRGDIYMLAVSAEYGDLLIGRSTDDGKSFCTPTPLVRGSCSNYIPGPHKNATAVTEHDGRIWASIEYGAWDEYGGHFYFTFASADANGDLLEPSNWLFSEPLKYSPEWKGAFPGRTRGALEGNAVVSPDGKLYNILRYETEKTDNHYGKIPVLEADTKNPEAPLKFSHFATLEANKSKFEIKRDALSGKYYTIADRIRNGDCTRHRNLLSLFVSDDLRTFRLVKDLIDYTNEDPLMVGVQYCSFVYDGDDILFVCRTAVGGAHSYHDSNYITFHKIKNFRQL